LHENSRCITGTQFWAETPQAFEVRRFPRFFESMRSNSKPSRAVVVGNHRRKRQIVGRSDQVFAGFRAGFCIAEHRKNKARCRLPEGMQD
jgi:hypothetical protein